MSEHNIQLVRGMVEAFNSDDQRPAISSFHPDVVCTSDFTESKTYVGLDGMGGYADDLRAVWESWLESVGLADDAE